MPKGTLLRRNVNFLPPTCTFLAKSGTVYHFGVPQVWYHIPDFWSTAIVLPINAGRRMKLVWIVDNRLVLQPDIGLDLIEKTTTCREAIFRDGHGLS